MAAREDVFITNFLLIWIPSLVKHKLRFTVLFLIFLEGTKFSYVSSLMHQETCISREANHVHGRVIKDLRHEKYLKIFSKLTCGSCHYSHWYKTF